MNSLATMGSPHVPPTMCHKNITRGAHQRGHATTHFLEGLPEGSRKEMLLRRVLRRCLARVSVETEVLRGVLRRGVIEGA